MRAPSSYDVTIIGAGNKSSFIERHGDSYFQKLVGVPERGLIMLLGSELRQELAFFLDTQVWGILGDMDAVTGKDLEGKTIEALFQYGNLVGVRIPDRTPE